MRTRHGWAALLLIGALVPLTGPAPAAAAVGGERITMAFSGDVLVHRPIIDRALANGGGRTYDFAPMFDGIRPLVSAVDLGVCHLETPVAPPGEPLSYHPIYGVPREIVDGIASAGYDRCSTASNHSADRGVTGIDATVTALQQAGLGNSGMARTPAETEPTVVDVRGVRVSHLAYTYGLNGLVLPAGQEWRVRLLDPDRIVADARLAKDRGAEYVVVSLHWGNETDWRITAAQRALAEVLTASGAVDLIVGHHVHVLQPIEQVNGVWVVYGLSNLLSNLPGGSERFPPSAQDGAVVTLSVTRRADGTLATGRPVVHPTWVDHERYLVRSVLDDLADPATPAGLRGALTESLARTRAVVGAYVPDGIVPPRCADEPSTAAPVTGFTVDASPSRFVPVGPARIYDSRAAGDDGYVCPGATVTVPVAGQGGVPPVGATAAVLNVTAVDAGRAGFVTVWPAGQVRPTASSLNLTRPGQVRPNLVIVPLGEGGAINVHAQSGVHVAVDVAGWFAPSGATAEGRIVAVDPSRVLDTRTVGRAVTGQSSIDVPVAGHGGVPATGAAAVVVNLTATDATAAGFVTAWPAGAARPGTSAINVAGPGEVAANLAVVPLGAGGAVSLYTHVTMHLVADVVGYVTGPDASVATAGRFVPVAPARALDTRQPSPLPGRIAAGGEVRLVHAGRAGVPATGAAAAVLNVTAVDASAAGYVTVYPGGTARPLASTVNVAAGDTRPNATVMRLGDDGSVAYYALSGADLVVDVTGWLTG